MTEEEKNNDNDINVFGQVLSIQSHTVHGYVGNRCAVLTLQLLGFEVDAINSVQFSNHTGYTNGFKGQILEGGHLDDLIEGLGKNDILRGYTHMLTGYIGSATFLRKVIDALVKLRVVSPELKYFCDPVLGDKGSLYVPESLVDIYITEVLPHVSVLTPNTFELELLTKRKIVDLDSALQAFKILHNIGIRTIFLTSCDFEIDKGLSNRLFVLASTCIGKDDNGEPIYQRIRVEQPLCEMHFTGTGDLIAALLLAWTTRHPDDLQLALEKACATMSSVVSRTFRATKANRNPFGELLIVQSRHDIETPQMDPDHIRAVKF